VVGVSKKEIDSAEIEQFLEAGGYNLPQADIDAVTTVVQNLSVSAS